MIARRRPKLFAAMLALASLGCPSEVLAYTSASFTTGIARPRYAVCKDEAAPPRAPPPRRAAGSPDALLVPIPLVRSPGKLTVVPHLVDDAAFKEPIPDRLPSSTAEVPARAPMRVARESVNDVHCLGLPRGRAALLRVLSAPPGTHFYGHGASRLFLASSMIAAAAFDVKEAVAPLRVALARPLPSEIASYDDVERVTMKGHAAMALAELGDVASAEKIRELLVALEARRVGTTWRDTLVGLKQLDRASAAAYAVDYVERMTENAAPRVSANDLEILLDAIDPSDAARARAALARIGTDGHDGCLAVGARLRLGDDALATLVRPSLEGTITTHLAATCWPQIVAALAPGKSMRELPVLLHRGRWEETAKLATVLRERGAAGAADRAAFLASVRAKEAKAPQGLRDHDHVHRFAALAAAGDEAALRALYAIASAPNDATDRPWIAVWHALTVGLPEAHAHAERLLWSGMRTDIAHPEVHGLRSGVAVSWPVKVVRELARQKSALAALGLLQRDVHAREEAMFAVSRARPEGACALVTNAAHLVPERGREAVDGAFWALSVLGSTCQPALERVARDRAQPAHVRGMALETLAMIRAPSATALADAWVTEGASREHPSLGRMRIILASPE